MARSKNTRTGMLLGVLAISAFVIVAIAMIFREPMGRVFGDASECESGIEYNGQKYDFKAALSLLKMEGKGSDEAIRPASDLLQIFLRDAQDMCRQAQRGSISSPEYLKYRERSAQRFASLVALMQTVTPNSLTPELLPVYLGALQKLNPVTADAPRSLEVRVLDKDGREIRSGQVLRSGEFYYLEIAASPSGYLYVFTLTSQDTLVRLYPSAAGGGANPVEGALRIPADSKAAFQLDTQTGVEHLLVFFEEAPNKTLASKGTEMGATPRSAEDARFARRLMQMRGSLLSRLPGDTPAAGLQSIESIYGNVVVDFVIDHR